MNGYKDKSLNPYSGIKIAPPGYCRFLLADALAFAVIFYCAVDAVLMISEGVYPAARGLAFAGAWTALLIAMALLNMRWHPDWGLARRAIYLLVEIAWFSAVLYVLYRFSSTPPHKGMDTLWIGKEWHMLPGNWTLMARVSPTFAIVGFAATAGIIALACSAHPRIFTFALGALGAFVVYTQVLAFPAGIKPLVYLTVFGGPVALAALTGLLLMRRMFARLALGSALGLFIFWSYSGMIPLTRPSGFEKLPGVSRLYPATGKAADFPLAFMREFEIDRENNALYTTFGPACGVVRIGLDNGAANVVEEDGLIRFLRQPPDENVMYGTDWDFTDLVTITKKPFAIASRQNLFQAGGVMALWEHEIQGRYHYIGTSEYPGIAKYLRTSPGGPLAPVSFLDFHARGYMKFRSAVSAMATHPATGRLFIELGPLDASRRFGIARVDPESMRVEKFGVLPEGGLKFILIPKHNSIIAASFYSSNFYEMDADTMAIRRTFRGPLNCRSLVYDERRDLIYATGFLSGRLQIIRYSDAKILLDTPVGKRTNGLALWPERDELFVGSAEGVFVAELKKFLPKNADATR